MNDGNNLLVLPVITIQCDWEDFIHVPHKRIWVSVKPRGQESVHGYIQGGTLLADNGFTANLGKCSLTVKHTPTGAICRFIPALKLFQKIHSKAVLTLDAADGGLGVSCCGANKLAVWDNSTGEVRRELTGHACDVYKCRLFPSGIVVLSGGTDMKIKIWSAENGQCPVTMTGHTQAITDLSIIDRGRNVLSVAKDGTVRLWHCGKALCIDILLKTTTQLSCCDIGTTPNGTKTVAVDNELEIGTEDKILLIGSEEGEIYGLVLSTRELLFLTKTESAINAILYFSNACFVTGDQDGRIRVYDLKTSELVRTIHESNSPVRCLARFKGNGFLVGRQDGTVTYYNILNNSHLRVQLTGPDCDPVYAIAVTDKAVFTGCRDGKIRKYQNSDFLETGI